jgi:uncharacterized protein YbjQ (UPF0145 family)
MSEPPQRVPPAIDDSEATLARIEGGGISLAAERRQQAAGSGRQAFASDLSVAAFALCHRIGLEPISQVMGSSIYQVGYQPATWPMMMGGGVITELQTLSEAWNEARRRALNRLELEARAAGAHAVVGVKVQRNAHDWAEGAIEYALTGTAVRRGDRPAPAQPVLTELSVADFVNLLRAGIEPAGIVAWTSVFFATFETSWLMGGALGQGAPMANFEVQEYTQAFYSARETVMERLGWQAQQLAATGIVGVNVSHRARRQEVGSGNRSRGGLIITFDAAGTAIREDGSPGEFVPKQTLDLSGDNE